VATWCLLVADPDRLPYTDEWDASDNSNATIPEGTLGRLFLTDVIVPGLSRIAAAQEVRTCHTEAEVLALPGYSADAVENQRMLPERILLPPTPVTPLVLPQRVRELTRS
jgi:hypothetical protein